jgi:two-component sensor histidine kinase
LATLPELIRDHTDLEGPVVAHLQRLVGSCGMLADLSFADLLLFTPVVPESDGPGGERFVVLGQVRPTTGQTLHREDLVGSLMLEEERPLVGRSWQLGHIVEGEVPTPSRGERGRLVAIPVRWQGDVVAILARESALSVGRRPGQLEHVYIEVFDRLARMIASGDFPFPIDDELSSEMPRVGDGVVLLDSRAQVEYASPNAINALHRMGTRDGIDGMRLDEVGVDAAAVNLSYQTRLPVTEEVERGSEVALILRCIPLVEHSTLTGALVLLKDITDLRRKDRLLLSKDAAIREVHHRVKNNLQTISSLLRLQARRVENAEARRALEESERRIRSIALVHEILSRDTKDQVDFNEIVPSLLRMAEDLVSGSRPVEVSYEGEAGPLQGALATPLAVVLTELLQNAAEHAFGEEGGDDEGACPLVISITLARSSEALAVRVRDNGIGLPPNFSIDSTASLGLSIVRSLVGSQMGGTIAMYTDGGTVVDLTIPVDQPEDDARGL